MYINTCSLIEDNLSTSIMKEIYNMMKFKQNIFQNLKISYVAWK